MHHFKDKGTYYLGVDIGGSHIAIGVVDVQEMQLLLESVEHHQINSTLPAKDILYQLLSALKDCIKKFPNSIDGIGISVPGPFDYENGISHMLGLNKYDTLFGINIKLYLQENLKGMITDIEQIAFLNDADSFVLGETYASNLTNGNVMGVTLGTGIGSGFIIDGNLVTNEKDVPYEGNIYNLEFKNRRLEDWISTKWFLDTYAATFSAPVNDVKTIAIEAENHQEAKEIFEQYGHNLGVALASITKPFNPNTIIVGGSISKSYHLFQETFENGFNNNTTIHITKGTSNAAMLGAVIHLTKTPNNLNIKRNSKQDIMPIESMQKSDGYNVYPTFELSSGLISIGIKSLVEQLPEKGNIIIDGYLGAYWDDIISGLSKALNEKGISHMTYAINAAYKDSKVLKEMVSPYLGGDDPVFGKIYSGGLIDFFDIKKLEQLAPEESILNIIYGPGAALANWEGKVIYMDTPKNELQFQARSGSVLNLGNVFVEDKKQQYKRMYFIDWPVLNRHKQLLLNNIDFIIDSQFDGEISWTTGEIFRKGLEDMSSNAFRVRPWFEPGIWGGDWMKSKIKGLPKDVPNYAWSFELIVPENGIVFSKNGVNLEVSFDFIMFYNNKAILGDAADTFGTDFPIRFDYLDTVNGQNLSLQCHPTLNYIQQNFGEKFTQDETYYILDADPEAQVYLGFKEGVKQQDFHKALKTSHDEAKPMAVKDYIQVHPAQKHDLFLIPHGTVHCSGIGNLVLEISSTPYIFTFKMYDWMRLDLDGKPRPLNIERGMENLNFDCQGEKVSEEYISKQKIVKTGNDWQVVNLSTHPKHFYEVNRFEFASKITVNLNEQCHILNLVEGSKVQVITNTRIMEIHYAETFVIPASVQKYEIINLGKDQAKVIQSNVKPEFCTTRF